MMSLEGQCCEPGFNFYFSNSIRVSLLDNWYPLVMVRITRKAQNVVLQAVNNVRAERPKFNVNM